MLGIMDLLNELFRDAGLARRLLDTRHVTADITHRMDDGTTQVDHILVSRFGVFVIETKDYSGWIFANAADAKWTSVHSRSGVVHVGC